MNKQEIEKVLDGLKRMRIAMFNYCIDGEQVEPFLDTAISALEKQIPKKPREHYNWCDLSKDEKLETPKWYCESCDGAIKENYSYCYDCGQAIDWRNEDE